MAEDISKLPKWAQTMLDTQQRNAEHWKRIALQVTSDEGTAVALQDYAGVQRKERYLPADATVRFYLHGKRDDRESIDVRLRDGALHLYTPHGTLIVRAAGGVNVLLADVGQW